MDRRWQLAAFALAVALVPQEGMAQGGGWVDPPATGAPAPRRVETNPTVETPPPAAPPVQPAQPPAPPAQSAQPARPPAPEPDVATRPEPARPAEPPRQQARPESPEPQRQQARPEAPEPQRQQARPEPVEPPRQQQARPEPVEPPRAPRPPAPREPAVAERPAERPAANLGQAAQRLALDYLGFWSASNDDTLDGMPDFYGSRVEFHGRSMSARALFEEKRRFVRRWPERSYSPRGDTMRVSCAPAGEVCTVRTQFDFYAANPQTGRRSAGTGQLELVVALAGPNPVIVSERSQVVRRGSLVTTEEVDED